jgi:hypothetical protein
MKIYGMSLVWTGSISLDSTFKLQLALIGRIALLLKNSGLLLFEIKEINKPHHNSLHIKSMLQKDD